MPNNIKVLVYPAKDLENTKALFGKFLGTEPYVESPYYVGYKVGDLEIGLDPNAESGPIAYTDVANIESSLKEMSDAGAEVVQDPKDVGNGLLIAKAKDANGNMIGFRQQS